MSDALPAGCLAVPVSPADAGAPLRLCALLRGGALVSLGEWPDASGFLGCVRDAGGRVREWLEWRVQQPPDDPNEAGLADDRWRRRAETLRILAPDDVLETGWETTRPAPMLLDAAGGEPHDAGTVPFNPHGGLLLARRFLPLDYEGLADALGGTPWPGVVQGRGTFPLTGVYETLRHIEEPERAGDGGHLFGARRGRAARLAEAFHLKIHLLLGAARAVRGYVAATGGPLLNVSAESFRVALGEPNAGLPFLWTARTVLVRPGDAVALAVSETMAGGQARYHWPGGAGTDGSHGGPTLYRPAAFNRAAGGRGTVRLRKVSAPGPDLLQVEGTLVAEENLPETPSDLLRLRLRVSDAARVDLFAHLDAAAGLAVGETRFRTVPQRFPAPVAAALQTAAGATFPGVPFETLPMLGSPCDLHALGVLGVRTLLVNDGNTLAEALDETLSLARQAAAGDASVPLETRLETLAYEDARWGEALGPGRLLRGGLQAGETVAELLPAGPWWSALAAVVRCFPGIGPDATCRDPGDAPAGVPEAAFDRLILDLETLARRTRGLVLLGDVALNREVRAAIRQFAAS